MSIRNLGDWSPLDHHSDPVYADPDAIEKARVRYKNIATTIDDAVARLQKVMDDNSEGLIGKYIDGLRKSATSLHDRLAKAAVRYHDVADQIKLYQDDLGIGLDHSATALTDARAAVTAQATANAMPDPQKSSDGTFTVDEQNKGAQKTLAKRDADDSLSAAKNRLNTALDDLDRAGKRFGDAVNSKNYKDGLTDTFKDKLDKILGKISEILGAIGMALAGLALLFPGLDVLVLAGVVVGAATLAVNSVLYHDGKGSLTDVIFGAVGLGLAGIGIGVSQLAKGLANDAKALANLGGRPGGPPQLDFTGDAFGEDFSAIQMNNFTHTPAPPAAGGYTNTTATISNWINPSNAATNWTHLSDWYNNVLTNGALSWLGGQLGKLPGALGNWGGKLGVTPEVSFWGSLKPQGVAALNMWKGLGSNPVGFLGEWAGVLGGWSGFRGLAGIMGAVGGKLNPMWFVWGGLNGLFGLGVGLGYTGGRLTGQIPAVNP